MESGSIAKWNLKEGDKFEAGQAICEVETDKVSAFYLCFLNLTHSRQLLHTTQLTMVT